MALTVGTRLGVYEVTAQIGEGGMGQVWRARDTKLNRDVALKVLPDAFANDPDRLARFTREAQTLASLNHPNIAHIHGLEESVGIRALVMELVEGKDLSQRLARGAISLDEALRTAKQICDALDAAHEKGIVHRDLKPANIKVTPDGVVKVLDFGLAKALGTGSDAGDDAPTMTADQTRRGALVGTPTYMSPEQARGLAVDKRTDIWAFGCVVYEMLTGRAAFSGATITDILAAVVNRDPDWSLLPPSTPANVGRVLRRCLEKDPKRRARDIADIAAELEDISPPGSPRHERTVPRQLLMIAAGIVALVGIGAAVVATVLLSRPSTAERAERRVQFGLTIPQQANDLILGTSTFPTPSPDGQLLAFVAGGSERHMVSVRALDAIDARPLPGTEGASGAVIWSPNGRWIGFFADGRLKKISPAGGPPQTIGAIRGFQDAAWGASGEIIFRWTNRAAISGISEAGDAPKEITKLDLTRGENSHRFLQFLPDGRRFLFTARCDDRQNNALFVGAVDSPRVTRVMAAQSRVSYVPGDPGTPGRLLFYQDGALMAQSFDLERMTLGPEPAPIFDKISYAAASIIAGFSASDDGRTLLVEEAGANTDLMTWFNRDGTSGGTLGPPGDYLQLRMSPSGDRVAYTKPDDRSGNRDIWYTDTARGITARLTTNGANDWFPAWSADGKELLFLSDRDGSSGGRPFLKKAIDVDGEEELVPEGVGSPWDWSRDGQWFLSSGDGSAISVQRIGAGSKPFHFLATRFLEFGGRFSPDGKWIAYVSNETGRFEVFVRPFTGAPASAGDQIRVSTAGGDFPVWGPDGQELFFMTADFTIYAVNTRNLGRSDATPTPVRLFKACPNTAPYLPPLTRQSYAFSFDTHDGQRFLVNCRAQQAGRYVVLLNALSRAH